MKFFQVNFVIPQEVYTSPQDTLGLEGQWLIYEDWEPCVSHMGVPGKLTTPPCTPLQMMVA